MTGRAPRGATLEQKLLHYSHLDGGHRIWDGALTRWGVPGDVRDGDRRVSAARAAFEVWVGAIPDGHEVRAACGTATCIAPEHLVTVAMSDRLRAQATKDECIHGHPLTPPNLYFDSTGARRCRQCRIDSGVRIVEAVDSRVRPTAIARGEPWTEDEDAVVMDMTMRVEDIALALGRTRSAVATRRHNLRAREP